MNTYIYIHLEKLTLIIFFYLVAFLFLFLNKSIFHWKGAITDVAQLIYIILEVLLLGLTIYQWLPSAPKGKRK